MKLPQQPRSHIHPSRWKTATVPYSEHHLDEPCRFSPLHRRAVPPTLSQPMTLAGCYSFHELEWGGGDDERHAIDGVPTAASEHLRGLATGKHQQQARRPAVFRRRHWSGKRERRCCFCDRRSRIALRGERRGEERRKEGSEGERRAALNVGLHADSIGWTKSISHINETKFKTV